VKRYLVNVTFVDGQSLEFETDTNIKLAQPLMINGESCLVTEDEYVINLRNVKKIDMTSLD